MKKKLFTLLLVFLLLFQCIGAGAAEITGSRLYYAINDIIEYVVHTYHFGVTDEELLRAVLEDAATKNGGQLDFDRAMEAIFGELDPYSEYYGEEEYQDLMENATGSFSGIGVTYLMQNGKILITDVFENGPAFEAGILPGDSIVSVGGRPVSEMLQGEVVNAIRGETGTVVEIGIMRGESTVVIPVVRAQVDTPELYSSVIEDGTIGYIEITGFNANTASKLEAALQGFKDQKIQKVIVDVRDNPGGMLSTVLDCLNLFVPKGKTVLNIKYKDAEVVYKSENKSARSTWKLAVLINGGSASASEIFAGAIQDNGVGTLVGETTYGKGTVQQILALNTGGGIKITTGEFFTPKGNTIRDAGVTPDIVVENKKAYVEEDNFSMLNLFSSFEVGASDPAVLGIEQRLNILGYFAEEPDEHYTEETAFAVKQFQFMQGLPVTGDADLATLIALNDIEYETYVYWDDLQLRAAIDVLNRK